MNQNHLEKNVYNDKISLHSQRGFTLIEVMIALFIFMVIALGLAKGEISALWAQSGNIYRDEALRMAEEELSRLKGEQFTVAATAPALTQAAWSIPQSLTVNMRKGSTTFARSIQITDIGASATELKRIDVAVGWTQGNNATVIAPTNRNHQLSLSTIMVQGD